MVSTLDSESSDLSSNLGGTCLILVKHDHNSSVTNVSPSFFFFANRVILWIVKLSFNANIVVHIIPLF